MTTTEPMTGNFVYNRLAICFFGTIFLILSIISYSFIHSHPFLLYLAVSFAVLFFFAYAFLLGDFTVHYLITMSNFFRRIYPKYKLIFWFIFGLILLGILISVGIILLGWNRFSEILISTLLYGVLMIILFVAQRIYEKYLKKKE